MSFKERYQAQVSRFHELLDKLSKHKLEGKEIKQLRVTTRRLRAYLWIVSRFFEDSILKTTAKELKDLGGQLGEIRRFEAAIEDSKDYDLDVKKLDRDRVEKLSELLRSYRALKISHLESDVHSLEPFFDKLPLDFQDKVIKKVNRRLHKLDKCRPHSAKDFHQIRISGKKMRYVLEAIGKENTPLTEMQAYLGKMNDLYTLKSFSDDDSLKKDFKKLKRGAKKLFKKKLEEAAQSLTN